MVLYTFCSAQGHRLLMTSWTHLHLSIGGVLMLSSEIIWFLHWLTLGFVKRLSVVSRYHIHTMPVTSHEFVIQWLLCAAFCVTVRCCLHHLMYSKSNSLMTCFICFYIRYFITYVNVWDKSCSLLKTVHDL